MLLGLDLSLPGLSVRGGGGDVTPPSGYAIAFSADYYTESVDDSSVSLDVTSAEVGASWALTISSSGGGTDVTDSGTVASASFTISGQDLTGLSPGTLTASLVLTDAAMNEGDPATDTATLESAYTFTNAEAEAVVAAFSVQPDDTRKELIDDLVGALKTAGTWSKMDLLYVMAAADEQSAKINWKNPGTNNLTNHNSTTFTADEGFTGNGSNMYLGTGANLNGLAQYTQDSAHAGVWARSANAISTAAEVSVLSGNIMRMRIRTTGDLWVGQINSTGSDLNANTDSVGHFVMNRSASNAQQGYSNGASNGSDTDASISLTATEILLFRDGGAGSYSARQLSVAHFGGSLTGTEVTDTYNAFNTYLSGL